MLGPGRTVDAPANASSCTKRACAATGTVSLSFHDGMLSEIQSSRFAEREVQPGQCGWRHKNASEVLTDPKSTPLLGKTYISIFFSNEAALGTCSTELCLY